MSAPWITFRPTLKVVDCTIRDGGLVNDHGFDDGFVKAVYDGCVAAGIDYMEIGYKASKSQFDPKVFGKWRFCDEDDVKRVLGDVRPGPTKLACMVDIGRVDEKDLLPQKESVFSMIRVACYVKDIDKAIALANLCMDKGYEASVNMMAVSTNLEKDIDEALDRIAGRDSTDSRPGGTFIAEEHTARNFRKELWIPRLLDRSFWSAWEEAGRPDSAARVSERLREVEGLPADVRVRLDVSAAREIHPAGLAYLAYALAGDGRVSLRGLSRRQERLLAYLLADVRPRPKAPAPATETPASAAPTIPT